MSQLLEILGIWGIGDSLWLALAPRRWATWWGRWLARLGRGGSAAWVVAGLQFTLSALLLWWAWTSSPRGRSQA